MKCPYCNNEMKSGELKGDGRTKIHWKANDEKLGFFDRICGKGEIDAIYSFGVFKIKSDYCAQCKKMIINTKVSE